MCSPSTQEVQSWRHSGRLGRKGVRKEALERQARTVELPFAFALQHTLQLDDERHKMLIVECFVDLAFGSCQDRDCLARVKVLNVAFKKDLRTGDDLSPDHPFCLFRGL